MKKIIINNILAKNLLSYKAKGFTLAEVLITIGIIGIIAALTIPAIIKSTNDIELLTAYKKAVSVANQAYTAAIKDNGGGFGAFNGTVTSLAYTKFNAIKDNLKIVTSCDYGTGNAGKCWPKNGIGKYQHTGSCTAIADGPFQNYSFATADGVYWAISSVNATAGVDRLAIDVNGEKGPNDWGKDAFLFIINDVKITPLGTNPSIGADCLTATGALRHNDGSIIPIDEFVKKLMN